MTPPIAFTQAMAGFASGVGVVCVRDEDDDVGITTTAVTSVSLRPPLLAVVIGTESYVDEVLDRQERWALTILSGSQVAVASRFAAAGRPSARILATGLAHHRGPRSTALIVDGGTVAVECRTTQRFSAGDHTVTIAQVEAVDYRSEGLRPLVRFEGRYTTLP